MFFTPKPVSNPFFTQKHLRSCDKPIHSLKKTPKNQNQPKAKIKLSLDLFFHEL